MLGSYLFWVKGGLKGNAWGLSPNFSMKSPGHRGQIVVSDLTRRSFPRHGFIWSHVTLAGLSFLLGWFSCLIWLLCGE
jgi:hypothetical protein